MATSLHCVSFCVIYLFILHCVGYTGTDLSLTSSWSDVPVCEGMDVEMTCVVQIATGIDENVRVTIIRDRTKNTNSYCTVWPLPEDAEIVCSGESRLHPNLMVNNVLTTYQTLVLLISIADVGADDAGVYECGVGTSSQIQKVADAPLTLVVQKSTCENIEVDTFSRNLIIEDDHSDNKTLMCVYNAPPSFSPIWFEDGYRVNHTGVYYIRSGAYTATYMVIDDQQIKMYTCAIKLREGSDDFIPVYDFQKPVIKMYPHNITSTDDYMFISIGVWVTSITNLLSPLSCKYQGDYLELMFDPYGTRSVTISLRSTITYIHLLNISTIHCQASNKIGVTSSTFDLLTILRPQQDHKTNDSFHTFLSETTNYLNTQSSSNPDQSDLPNDIPIQKPDNLNDPLPYFLGSSIKEIILFSILVFLVSIFVVLTCIFCTCKHHSSCTRRLRSGANKKHDTYWSFLHYDKTVQSDVTHRSLPHRPDSAYAYCLSDVSPTYNHNPLTTSMQTFVPASLGKRDDDQGSDVRLCRLCSCRQVGYSITNNHTGSFIRQTYFVKDSALTEYLSILSEDEKYVQHYSAVAYPQLGRRFKSLPNVNILPAPRNRTYSL